MSQQLRTKWGRARFGAGRVPALAVAVPGGLVLGAAGGCLAVAAGIAGSQPVAVFLVFWSCLTVPAVLLVYLAVVDRSTIEGGVERPDDSIEAGWYDKAASRALTDLILVLGITTVVLSFLPADIQVDLNLVLPAVVVFCAVSVGVRYLLLKRKG